VTGRNASPNGALIAAIGQVIRAAWWDWILFAMVMLAHGFARFFKKTGKLMIPGQ